MPNSIVRTEHGAFCAVCQSLLSIEEEDFGVCDACDGEGIGGLDDDDGPDTPQDHTPPELRTVLSDALAKQLLNPPLEDTGQTGNARAVPAMTGSLPVAGTPTLSQATDE